MKRIDELKVLFGDAEGRIKHIYSKSMQVLSGFACPEAAEFRPAREMMETLKEIISVTEVYIPREERANLAKVAPTVLSIEKSGLSEEDKEKILRGEPIELTKVE